MLSWYQSVIYNVMMAECSIFHIMVFTIPISVTKYGFVFDWGALFQGVSTICCYTPLI